MAFAPHTNSDVICQRRSINSIDTELPPVLGAFDHAETKAHFEYAERRNFPDDFAPDYPHMVYVGPLGETRLARVLKTVAYVVTDESEEGILQVERWPLRRVWVYDAGYLASWNHA